MSSDRAGNVYRLVFELTARATDIPYEKFLDELVQGLATHYGAAICRLHIGEGNPAAACADPEALLDGIKADERSRFDAVDRLLAEEVRRDGVLRTALDLDGGEEIVNFLGRTFRTPETFAFPLMARSKAFGAIVLFLAELYPFEEADVRGLQAIGNVLYAANHKGEAFDGGPGGGGPALTSEKLRAYQETLDRVGKILEELQFLTDASNVLLLDAQGDFIAKRGEDSMFSSANFATVVASGFAAARRLGSFYGANRTRSLLHEGDREDVFVSEVADRALLCVVYRDHGAPELITRWAESAAERLREHYAALTEARVL